MKDSGLTLTPKVFEKDDFAILHISDFDCIEVKLVYPKMIDRNLEVIRDQGGFVMVDCPS